MSVSSLPTNARTQFPTRVRLSAGTIISTKINECMKE